MTYKLMPESLGELKKLYATKKAAAEAARTKLEQIRATFKKQGDLTRSLETDVSNLKKRIADMLLERIADMLLEQEGLEP